MTPPSVSEEMIRALKPCPFCGASAEMEPWHGGGPDKQMISCSGPVCEVCPMVTGETPAEAVEVWNRRAHLPAGSEAVKPLEWRCFHCDEVFTSAYEARKHFGGNEDQVCACQIKGAEGGLVAALRRAEQDAADAWAAIHNENTDAAKAYHAQASRHREQLTAIEQVGYDRGIADAKAHPETLGLFAAPPSTPPAANVQDDWDERAKIAHEFLKTIADGTGQKTVEGYPIPSLERSLAALLLRSKQAPTVAVIKKP